MNFPDFLKKKKVVSLVGSMVYEELSKDLCLSLTLWKYNFIILLPILWSTTQGHSYDQIYFYSRNIEGTF